MSGNAGEIIPDSSVSRGMGLPFLQTRKKGWEGFFKNLRVLMG